MSKWVKSNSGNWKNMDWIRNIYVKSDSGSWSVVGTYGDTGLETVFSSGHATEQDAIDAMNALVTKFSNVVTP